MIECFLKKLNDKGGGRVTIYYTNMHESQSHWLCNSPSSLTEEIIRQNERKRFKFF